MCHTLDLGSYAQGQGRDQRSKSCLSKNSKTTEANLTKLHRKIEHYDMVFHAQELGSYAQGQGFLAVFKVTARNQGYYEGPSGAFVTYCNISCFFQIYTKMGNRRWQLGLLKIGSHGMIVTVSRQQLNGFSLNLFRTILLLSSVKTYFQRSPSWLKNNKTLTFSSESLEYLI